MIVHLSNNSFFIFIFLSTTSTKVFSVISLKLWNCPVGSSYWYERLYGIGQYNKREWSGSLPSAARFCFLFQNESA